MGRRDTNVRVRLQRRPYERLQLSAFDVVTPSELQRTEMGSAPVLTVFGLL